MPEITADQLARMAAAATPGEWTVEIEECEEHGCDHGEIFIPEIERTFHSCEWADAKDWDRDQANAEFMAACATNRAHLIACLREHESRAAQWVDICIIEPTAPFITNVSAGWGKPALDSIEEELIDGDWENLPGVPPGAVSVRCKANHCAAQIGDEGRVELPAYWDLTPIGYEVMDDAGVSTYAAVEKAVRNG